MPHRLDNHHAAFVEVVGKLSKCKYGFPFQVPEPEERPEMCVAKYISKPEPT